jgi:hypothetical protein
MPEGGMLDTWRKGQAGIAFMVAFGESFQIVGAFSSSPWTITNVGADDKKAKSAIWFIGLAIANNMVAYGVLGSLLTQSYAPLVGTVLANAEIALVYRKAIADARKEGDGSGWF